MKYIIFLILVLLTIGCDEPDIKENIEVGIVQTRVLDIALDSLTSQDNLQYQYFENDEKRLFIFFNMVNSSLYCYNYATQKLVDIIPFAEEGPEGVGSRVISFYYHNEDSIFLHSYYKRQIMLFNSQAELINAYKLANENVFGVSLPKTGHLTPMYLVDKKLYLNNSGKCNRAKSETAPPNIIEIDLISGNSNYFMNYPKESYSEPNGWPGNLCNMYQTFLEDRNTFAFGYAMSHDLYVTQDFETFQTKDFSSHVVLKQEFEPVHLTPRGPLDLIEASARFAQYGALYYDPYRQYLLRFANTQVPEDRIERRKFKPDQNIIIQNLDYDYVGEVTDFKGSHYLFFTKEGINQVQRDYDNQDNLQIKIYKYDFNEN